jgi:hypothetical protein
MSAHKRRYDEDEDVARSSKRHRSERTDRNEERSHRHADSGYTDKSNPFGDGNLTQRFEWRAKDKKLKEQGSDPRRMSKEQELEREEEIRRDLAKLKERREERERWEAEKARLEREKWNQEQSEGSGELAWQWRQTRLRSEQRVMQQRAGPVDWLYKLLAGVYMHASKTPGATSDQVGPYLERDTRTALLDQVSEMDLIQPAVLLRELSADELRATLEDIGGVVEWEPRSRIEGTPYNTREFWQSVDLLVRDQLQLTRDESGAVHQSIQEDIDAIFDGKNFKELCELEQQIQGTIDSGQVADEEYWHSVLKRLVVFKAHMLVREVHHVIMTRDRQTRVTAKHGAEQWQRLTGVTRDQEQYLKSGARDQNAVTRVKNVIRTHLKQYREVRAGSADQASEASGEESADELTTELRPGGVVMSEQEMLAMEQARGLDENEELFNQDYPLAHLKRNNSDALPSMANIAQLMSGAQSSASADKYKPRKPKYYNRVKSGYEWNKYNQTHYDQDNPPPKVIQGYQFNIFYPDLIDPTKSPQYFIEPTESHDHVILRFHAGPPYEDIAFKIVHKEWEKSHRKGFKSTFMNGILQLWFSFKRYKYRR